MKQNLWLDFEHYKKGKLYNKYTEPAHSWTIIAYKYMINFFSFIGTDSIGQFNGVANNTSNGIILGSSDKPFSIYDCILDQKLTPSILKYLATTILPIEYNTIGKEWTSRIKRGVKIDSAHLGGYDMTIKEIGLYKNDQAWARDVLGTPILMEPLDELYITYRIHTDMSQIDGD